MDKSILDLNRLGAELKRGTVSPDTAMKALVVQMLDDMRQQMVELTQRISDCAELLSRDKEFTFEVDRNSRTQLITSIRARSKFVEAPPSTAVTG